MPSHYALFIKTIKKDRGTGVHFTQLTRLSEFLDERKTYESLYYHFKRCNRDILIREDYIVMKLKATVKGMQGKHLTQKGIENFKPKIHV